MLLVSGLSWSTVHVVFHTHYKIIYSTMYHGHAIFQALSCWSLAVEACIQSQCHPRGRWRKHGTWTRFFLYVFNSLATQLNAHYVMHHTGIWRVHNRSHKRLSAIPIIYCYETHTVWLVYLMSVTKGLIYQSPLNKKLCTHPSTSLATVSTQGHSNKRITCQFHPACTFTIKILYCTVREMIHCSWLRTLLMPLFSAKCDSHLSIFTISPLHFYSHQPCLRSLPYCDNHSMSVICIANAIQSTVTDEFMSSVHRNVTLSNRCHSGVTKSTQRSFTKFCWIKEVEKFFHILRRYMCIVTDWKKI